MNEVKKNKDILYRVQKDWPIKGVNFVDLTPTLVKIILEKLLHF